VQQWLSVDPANQAYYDELKKTWLAVSQLQGKSVVDENKAWERFQVRIRGTQTTTLTRSRSRWWMRAAAVIVLLIGAWWIYNLVKPGEPAGEMLVQTQQQVLTDTLPDGSFVTLNKQSSISYPEKFKGDARKIVLKGEAFFNVTPDKSKPFIIDINDVRVTVVGTSFNVKNKEGNTEVVVETGVVSVTRNNQTVELKAGEKLSVMKTDSILQKEQVDDRLYNYYRTKEFVCDDTPLWKLVEVLNEAYNANIKIGRSELRNLKLNTTFVNESLEQVLNIISLTFTIKINKQGEKIILE
jgi:transmembrane sensor